jgi:hypothetical protein
MGHKYLGLDVRRSSTVAAVHDEQGKSVMEPILPTEAEVIRDFLKGLRRTTHYLEWVPSPQEPAVSSNGFFAGCSPN